MQIEHFADTVREFTNIYDLMDEHQEPVIIINDSKAVIPVNFHDDNGSFFKSEVTIDFNWDLPIPHSIRMQLSELGKEVIVDAKHCKEYLFILSAVGFLMKTSQNYFGQDLLNYFYEEPE